MPRFEPRVAGFEVQTLLLCFAAFPPQGVLNLVIFLAEYHKMSIRGLPLDLLTGLLVNGTKDPIIEKNC